MIHWLLLSKSSLSNLELKRWAQMPLINTMSSCSYRGVGAPLGFPHATQQVPSPQQSPKLKKKTEY